MFFKGTYQTTSLGNSQGEIYSGDGNMLSPTCAIMGYWNPENFSGIGTTYENSVSGQNDLDLVNGIYFNSGESPKNFELDGTNDYIGPIGGAYGSSFKVDITEKWSVCMWVKFDTTEEDLTWNPLFSIGEINAGSEGGFEMREANTGFQYDPANDTQSIELSRPPVPETGRWYFMSVIEGNPGASFVDKAFDVHVDGRYIIQDSEMNYNVQTAGYKELMIGVQRASYEGFGTIYTTAKAGLKIGEIMVYSGDIGLSRVVQNYNATKPKYNEDSQKF